MPTTLLGTLLARRAGMGYEALLKQRVLVPLQLTSTSITVNRSQKARLAPGHNRYLQPVDTWEMRAMPASGSLRSTANDLLKLLAAYLHPGDGPLKEVLPLSVATRFPPASAGAMGWTCRKIETEEVCYKDGGKAGYRSAVAIAPGSGNGFVVLANARTDDRPQDLALHPQDRLAFWRRSRALRRQVSDDFRREAKGRSNAKWPRPFVKECPRTACSSA